jgi:hypothetical protein
MRAAAMLAAVVLMATASSKPLALRIDVQRSSLDLLDSLSIGLVVDNVSGSSRTLQFPQPIEYVIEVQDAGRTIWSSLPASPAPQATFKPHDRNFAPGATPLVFYAWNQVARGGWSPTPGTYVLKARLLNAGTQPMATARVRFVAPLAISAVAALPPNELVTVAGRLDDSRQTLGDGHDSIRLTRRIPSAPVDTKIVVRGSSIAQRDGSRDFAVLRWAVLGPPRE